MLSPPGSQQNRQAWLSCLCIPHGKNMELVGVVLLSYLTGPGKHEYQAPGFKWTLVRG